MKNKKVKILLTAGALAGILATGGVLAYFTDQDDGVNKFTVGRVEIDLQEPEWEEKPDTDGNDIPDEAEEMTPNQTISKDPQVENTGVNDAYIFLTVEVPCRNIVTANADGTKNPKALTDLYSFTADNSWTRLGACEVLGDDEKTVIAHKYLYAYAVAGGDCTVVEPGKTTKKLFTEVTFVNAVEGQGLEEEQFEIAIDAYGIQTTDLNGGVKTPQEVWKVITNQNEVSEVYK
ncbi:MAG: TasA family protein [Lachnospiraceae bacterium]